MTTAILTITCPHCGGRIENVRTTAAEQTIPCPFCRTELYIPHVGTERVVIHEVIREVSEPANELVNDAGLLKPSVSVGGRFIVGLLSLVALFIMFGMIKCHSASVIHDMDACEASCKNQCVKAGDGEPPDREGEIAMHDSLADGDRVLCETSCERAAKCWGR